MKTIYLLLAALLLQGCMKRKYADLVVHNAVIHTLDEKNSLGEAMAIRDGKILEVGPERQILNKYRWGKSIDAKKKHIYPGFIDAHTHLFSLAKQRLGIDLTQCRSFDDMVDSISTYFDMEKRHFIIGRGWNQTTWSQDIMPNNDRLSELFPDIPVALYRIDGHALLVNDALLDQITDRNPSFRSSFESGLFIDHGMLIPEAVMNDYQEKDYRDEILTIQQQLLHFGITGVHEAGINAKQFQLLKAMDQSKELRVDLYAMLMANEENFALAAKMKHYSSEHLSVRSFKLLLDGALGSRGALLKQPYLDEPHHHGLLLASSEELSKWVERSLSLDYQLNVHAIGDSANKCALLAFRKAFLSKPDHRWRIEHAQTVDPNDLHWFRDYAVFPSVQPTHATSDYSWAIHRLGKQRLAHAYTYRSLLEQFGMLAFGTDFPVESMNPFLTLRVAVLRVTPKELPQGGFQKTESISFENALKAMTVWPQFASFTETKRGSLTEGMEANFFIAEKAMSATYIPADNWSRMTFIRGRKVYDSEQ
ncbi:MAG: amidohydrolase [Flavobacteriia bacterium]|nr:amidohydrolase [Flavobacteriia bacterium]